MTGLDWAQSQRCIVQSHRPADFRTNEFPGGRIAIIADLTATLLGEMFASQRGLGYMLMNAIGLHNVDVIMAVTFLLTAFAAVVSGILLAIDRHLHRRG